MKMLDGMVRTLVDARHVPGLKKNLISLGTLDKNGCRISCQDGVMKVIRGSVVMKGKMNGSLYALEGSTIFGFVNVSTIISVGIDAKQSILEYLIMSVLFFRYRMGLRGLEKQVVDFFHEV